MLINSQRAPQLEIAKRTHLLARLRQHESKIAALNSVRTSMVQQNLLVLNREGSAVKLPQLGDGQGREKSRKNQKKPVQRKKEGQEQKLMEMIKKEISLEKQNYFHTISSDKALIVKNSARPVQKTDRVRQQRTEEDPRTMTPILKAYRSGKTMANDSLPKTTKKTFKEEEREESCSPWNYQQSEEVTVQEERKDTDTL